MVVAEKKNTWAKQLQGECQKRETEIFKIMGCLADDAKDVGGDGNRVILMQFLEKEEEEYEARALLEASRKM